MGFDVGGWENLIGVNSDSILQLTHKQLWFGAEEMAQLV